MPPSEPKYKILIVDDTPENIDILVNLLKPHYKLSAALNGQKALKIAFSGSPPDLVLLDIMMPEMDGYEVCRRLKEDEATREIPVIFVTAKSEVEDETRGFETGAVDYITKPISPPIVLARVRTHLALCQARRTLEKQNRDLIEAAQLREDVDRIMRHDLKGPLTSIIGLPQLLLMKSDIPEKHQRAIKTIEQSGLIMLNMINLSLDLFKMERGTYEFSPQPVDLVALFNKILEDQNRAARAKTMETGLFLDDRPAGEDDAFFVQAEELLAYSLFSNLVKNAIEASPDGGPLRVGLERRAGEARIKVFNHGTVPEEIRERFFDKYVTAGKRGGTGLGTYSARLMAETMQGSIHLESSSDDGTTITVLLRVAETEASIQNEPAVEIPEPDPMHVLAVDDDPHGRQLILRMLEHPALTVDAAGDGREALDRMTRESYDIVFMDVEMPVMDGFEAISRFRAWESESGTGPLPVIALTGHDSDTVRERLMAAGFTNLLSKPVSARDLFSAMHDPAGDHSREPAPAPSVGEEEGDTVQVDADFEGMVEDFLEDNRAALSRLLEAGDGDVETIARLVHTLAGTGRMYGLGRLSRMGAELEEAAKAVPPGDLKGLMRGLADYIGRIRIEFVSDG